VFVADERLHAEVGDLCTLPPIGGAHPGCTEGLRSRCAATLEPGSTRGVSNSSVSRHVSLDDGALLAIVVGPITDHHETVNR
jgi:hypothetical protein